MIDSFTGEYRFLSNFWPCLVKYEGHSYPSVEHAYVAAKTTDPAVRELIREVESPGQVKRLGRKLAIRNDWDAIKLSVMYELLQRKFSQPKFRAKLIATAPHELIEGNTWGDTFWGVCNGEGSNYLGRLLMKVRAEASQSE